MAELSRNLIRAKLGLPPIAPAPDTLGGVPAWVDKFKEEMPEHDEAWRVHQNILKLTGDKQAADLAYQEYVRQHLVKHRKP